MRVTISWAVMRADSSRDRRRGSASTGTSGRSVLSHSAHAFIPGSSETTRPTASSALFAPASRPSSRYGTTSHSRGSPATTTSASFSLAITVGTSVVPGISSAERTRIPGAPSVRNPPRICEPLAKVRCERGEGRLANREHAVRARVLPRTGRVRAPPLADPAGGRSSDRRSERRRGRAARCRPSSPGRSRRTRDCRARRWRYRRPAPA